MFSEEDTAFMDMTHSHTIIIDNKADETAATMSSCGNLDFTAAVGGAKTTVFDNSRREVTAFKSCSTSGKGPIKKSELEDFLASLTQSSGSGRLSSNIKSESSTTPFAKVPSPAPKVDAKHFHARLRAHRSAVDQENEVPVTTRKSAHQDGSSQQCNPPHWCNDRTMIAVEQENMDLTKTHTAIIGDELLFTRKSFAPSAEEEDMEMTKSQTVVIASKAGHMVNSSKSTARGLSMLAPNKTILFSEADHDMEMTGALTGYIEEKQNPFDKRDEMVGWLFPETNTFSHSRQIHRMEKKHAQIDANVPNCLWLASSSDPEDMEMTRSQTVVIDSKHCQMAPSLGKPRSVSCMLAPNKTVMFSEVDHDMELTDAFTGHLEVNGCSSNQKDKRSMHLFPSKNTISHAGQNYLPERTSSQMVANDCNNSLWPATLSNSDDMEMTRSQTVIIDSKHCLMTPSLSKPRSVSCMLSPNKTVIFSETDHEMEMTKAFTGHLDVNEYFSTQGDESVCSFPANTILGQKDFSEKISSLINANVCNKSLCQTTLSNTNDMEMTRSQTVVIDSKTFPVKNLSASLGNKSACCMSAPNKTIMYSEGCNEMEMTGDFTGHIEESWNPSTKRTETTSRLFPTTNAVDHTSHTNDMDMTRSQTVVIDSKSCPIYSSFGKVRSVSGLSSNKTIMFSDVDHDMELTDTFTVHIEENQNPSTERHERNNWIFPVTNTVALTNQTDGMEMRGSQIGADAPKSNLYCSSSSNPDYMDMTRSKTVVIDSKSCPTNPAFCEVRKVSCLSPPQKNMLSEVAHDIEIADAFERHIVENTRVCTDRNKTLDQLSATRQNTECSGVWDMVSFDPNDMEMTRSQTVVIDSKYCGKPKASLNIVRKSLSSVLPTSKALRFPIGYCETQVPKALIGLDMDSKKFPTSEHGTVAKLSPPKKYVTAFDQLEVTAVSDPDVMEIRSENVSKRGVKQNPLPATVNMNMYCESGSDKSQNYIRRPWY